MAKIKQLYFKIFITYEVRVKWLICNYLSYDSLHCILKTEILVVSNLATLHAWLPIELTIFEFLKKDSCAEWCQVCAKLCANFFLNSKNCVKDFFEVVRDIEKNLTAKMSTNIVQFSTTLFLSTFKSRNSLRFFSFFISATFSNFEKSV